MLDKRQIQAILLFEFRMGSKIAETTCNVSNAFGKGTANECTVQGWFKKFYKGDGSLEVEECSGRPQKLTMTIVSHQWSWSSYNYMRRCQRIQHQPFCGCSAFKANFVQSLSSTLYSTMDCSIPGFPVLLKLPESAQTHVHWVNITFLPRSKHLLINFMAAVTICSDFGAPKIKLVTISTVSPSICHETSTLFIRNGQL